VCGVKKWQQLRPHLTAPEREGFDHDDVRTPFMKESDEQGAPVFPNGLSDRHALRVDEGTEVLIRSFDGRQIYGLDTVTRKTIDWHATRNNGDLISIGSHRARDSAGPHQMSDAEKMLDVKKDSRSVHGRGVLEARRSTSSLTLAR
jgi:hypothetical protein